MRIINSSKFNDYYDGLHNPKDTLIYNRKIQQHVIEVKDFRKNVHIHVHSKIDGIYHKYVNVSIFVILFCGKQYPGVELLFPDGTSNYSYSFDILLKRITKIKNLNDSTWDPNYVEPKYMKGYHRRQKWTNDKEYIKSIFENGVPELNGMNIKYKAPIAIVSAYGFNSETNTFNGCDLSISGNWGKKTNIVLNTNICLKQLDFQKVISVEQCYQNIDMFVGNELVEDKMEQWPVPDKIKAESHGFNKFSFRKDKQQ